MEDEISTIQDEYIDLSKYLSQYSIDHINPIFDMTKNIQMQIDKKVNKEKKLIFFYIILNKKFNNFLILLKNKQIILEHE